MEHIEDTVEEIQPDGSIMLRRVIVPVRRPPMTTEISSAYDIDVPLGEMAPVVHLDRTT